MARWAKSRVHVGAVALVSMAHHSTRGSKDETIALPHNYLCRHFGQQFYGWTCARRRRQPGLPNAAALSYESTGVDSALYLPSG